MIFATVKKKSIIAVLSVIVTLVLISLMLFSPKGIDVFKADRKLPIYRVQREDNKIAISFDCAWGVDYTDELLSVMQEENVRCTFFAVEFWTNKHPDYVKKIVDYGHEFGTHSATHPYMSKQDKVAIEKELKTSADAIEKITGRKVELFRPPYGDYDDLLVDTAKELGLYTIQWDVDSLDWKDLSANEITDRVVKRVKSGSIVLFHNQGLNTAKALPQIIKTLKAKGYEFVPISELIYKDGYSIAPDGEQQKKV